MEYKKLSQVFVTTFGFMINAYLHKQRLEEKRWLPCQLTALPNQTIFLKMYATVRWSSSNINQEIITNVSIMIYNPSYTG